MQKLNRVYIYCEQLSLTRCALLSRDITKECLVECIVDGVIKEYKTTCRINKCEEDSIVVIHHINRKQTIIGIYTEEDNKDLEKLIYDVIKEIEKRDIEITLIAYLHTETRIYTPYQQITLKDGEDNHGGE